MSSAALLYKSTMSCRALTRCLRRVDPGRLTRPVILQRDFHFSPIRRLSEEQQPASEQPKQYSTPEVTEDARRHKEGLSDPEVPEWDNPLHHYRGEDKIFPEDFDSEEEFRAAQAAMPPLNGQIPAHIEALAEEVVNLTMLEMNELINKIGDHFGFDESMMSPDGEADAGGEDEGEAAPAAVEKTAFDIKLVSFDAKAKIKIIKEVRAIAGLGLKEAKEMVEGAPKVIQKDIKKEQAEEIKAKLEELGAVIEIA